MLSEMYPPDLTQLQTQWSGDAGFPPQSSEASSQHESAVEQVSLAASQRITHDAQSANTISDMILFRRFIFDTLTLSYKAVNQILNQILG